MLNNNYQYGNDLRVKFILKSHMTFKNYIYNF